MRLLAILFLAAGCSATNDFVPTPPPAYDFDWRVYNGQSYTEPKVVEIQTQPSWKRATYENRARRVVTE